MTRFESIPFDQKQVADLRRMVAGGEGLHMEFKRKATFPDKIVRELIAFANTDGGILLVGVEDDKTISGLKFPEEESLSIREELKKHCRPVLEFEESVIRISSKKAVLCWKIPRSPRRPHYYVSNGARHSFVRRLDESLKASREMCEIMRRSRSEKGTHFTYGDAEQKIIHALDSQETITLRDVTRLAGVNKFLASRKLVRLVLANVLRITPTGKGDLFSRA